MTKLKTKTKKKQPILEAFFVQIWEKTFFSTNIRLYNSHFRQFLEKLNDRISKRKQLALFWALFGQIWAKINFMENLGSLSSYIIEIIQYCNFMKEIRKKTINQTLISHDPLFTEINMQKKLDHFMAILYLLDVLLIILKYFGLFHSWQTKSNWFSTLISDLYGVKRSGVMLSDTLRASWAINQVWCEFCQV